MILEIRRIHATSLQGLFKVFATVKPLPAGCNFHTLEQQIETICRPGRSSRSCVERAPQQWKPEHENSGDTGVLLRKLTQLSLRFWIEIVAQIGPVVMLFQ